MFDWEFRDPWFLILGLLAPLIFRWMRRPTSSVQYSSLSLLEQTPGSVRARLSWIPALLMALAIASTAIALARPRTGDSQTRISREGIAIMMVADRSGSMNARDMVRGDASVDRLSVVKDVFVRFVLGDGGKAGRGREADLIGLVTFAGYADSICPLTSDHGNLVNLVRQLKVVDDREEDGTAVGDGLGLALERLRQTEVASKVVILLTDGVHNAGVIEPLKAAELAKKLGVKVYCIGVGTNGVAPFPVRDPFSGRVVLRGMPVEIDEKTLTKIADSTGGRYFRATDASTLAEIYAEIDRLERTKVEEIRYLNYTEHFTRFVIGALTFVIAASVLQGTLFRRIP